MIEAPSETRSRIMRAVKAKDTKPELIVRRGLHAAGYRYRLHRKGLPGSPDLVFPSRRKVIFVHGCFWHGHNCARGARTPKTNVDFWRAKIERNKARDARVVIELHALGWIAATVWECELKERAAILDRLRLFLES